MRHDDHPCWLAGERHTTGDTLDVLDKYTGERATGVALAGPAEIDAAIEAAAGAARAMRALRPYQRRDALAHCARRFEERSDELAHALCVEAGKPIRDARGEVARLVDTFRVAAEEATRRTGEVLPLEVTPRARGYTGMWTRVPIGPCGFVTPFNFPLNLVAHKVAPALAVGCPFVLKPASATPVGALLVGEVLAELDLPRGVWSILPARSEHAEALATDERIAKLSFTGSAEVGWKLKSIAGKKRVTLELGGNAPAIVDAGVDLDDTVARLVHGAFYQSGQSCIAVQRILALDPVFDALVEKLVAATEELVAGDPKDEDTFVGPLVTEDDARRCVAWIESAVDAGARVLCGGTRAGAVVRPTLLADVPEGQEVLDEEVFGPVAVVQRVPDFGAALAEANRTRFGLQAGVFTRDLYRAKRAFEELEYGGVVVGDVPSWRVDHMPYGGVKDSGLGREGLRWAMDEMSEMRLLVIRDAEDASD